MSDDFTHLQAPGVQQQPSPRERSIIIARRILENYGPDDPFAILSREYLRAIGVSERG